MHGVQPDMCCVGTVSRTQVRCVETVTCCCSATVTTRLVEFSRNLKLCHVGMDSDTELRPTDKEKSCEFPGLERPAVSECVLYLSGNIEERVLASCTDPCKFEIHSREVSTESGTNDPEL